MDKLIICETDRGRYAVRPMSWAGIWNEKGQIQESLNHFALFMEKEYAEKFVEWKEAEEQNKPLNFLCAVGDTVYTIYSDEDGPFIREAKIEEVSIHHRIWVDSMYFDYDDFGKTVFLTRKEAEDRLAEMAQI